MDNRSKLAAQMVFRIDMDQQEAQRVLKRRLMEEFMRAAEDRPRPWVCGPVKYETHYNERGDMVITAYMEVSETESMQVRTLEIQPLSYRTHQAPAKKACAYCGAVLKLNGRGCCSACGGPPGDTPDQSTEWYENMAQQNLGPAEPPVKQSKYYGIPVPKEFERELFRHLKETSNLLFSEALIRGHK